MAISLQLGLLLRLLQVNPQKAETMLKPQKLGKQLQAASVMITMNGAPIPIRPLEGAEEIFKLDMLKPLKPGTKLSAAETRMTGDVVPNPKKPPIQRFD